MPGAVVNVATEKDVQVTVRIVSAYFRHLRVLIPQQGQYCIHNHVPFLPQNGGNGRATTFTLDNNGIIINLARLTEVIFKSAKTQATLQGGA